VRATEVSDPLVAHGVWVNAVAIVLGVVIQLSWLYMGFDGSPSVPNRPGFRSQNCLGVCEHKYFICAHRYQHNCASGRPGRSGTDGFPLKPFLDAGGV
jgi:hypothetical protein